MLKPDILNDEKRFDSFKNGKALYGKKKGNLPAMGWNSWNAFGSGNTEALTKAMTDKMVELGLRELGYKYIVLDDGCYKPERVDGKLSNEEVKFPSGFKALADYIHERGLKFGMYNDIGTNLCAGAAVGTCGHEAEDAKSYIDWDVDFMKVDNCYYPFDNATFSNPENAKYVFAPGIKSVRVVPVAGSNMEESGKADKENASLSGSSDEDNTILLKAGSDGKITGNRASCDGDVVTGIGTFDGTGPEATPVGDISSELIFDIEAACDSMAKVYVEYTPGKEEGKGSWLQLAVGDKLFYDDFLSGSDSNDERENIFIWSKPIEVSLKAGMNHLRIMNHRRQENTLNSYARLLEQLNKQKPDNDIIYSACEWGKNQPQNWAYKVCDSWRILNDITFRVGSDGDPGHGAWKEDYTTSVTTQYNKAVIMDEFAGLDKGWNDPDMLMIGMDGLNETQCRTHMAMWCMMNSPIMLGLDLRRVEKGDWIHRIITNKDLLSINQDGLGVQAKRIFSTLSEGTPDKEYIRDINRVDILLKPLQNECFALSFINISEEDKQGEFSVKMSDICKCFDGNIKASDKYIVRDVWTGEETENTSGVFSVHGLKACENHTVIIRPIAE